MHLFARLFAFTLLLSATACGLAATRPVQEMSNTAAAIRAAREVQADTRAPELYRQANEWFFKARQEYKLKNFKEARLYTAKARRFAEEAEYEAVASGASRVSAPPDPYAAVGAEPVEKEKPTKKRKSPPIEGVKDEPSPSPGVYVESYEEQESFKKKLELEKAGAPAAAPPNQIIIQQQPGVSQPSRPAPSPATR